jgi:hypothetical protein
MMGIESEGGVESWREVQLMKENLRRGLGSPGIIGQEEFKYICVMHSIRIYVFICYIYIVDEVHNYE